MTAHVARVIEFLRSRYGSFGLLVFGDLNTDLSKSTSQASKGYSRTLEMINSQGLSVHFAKEPGSATRVQGSKSSYLDYFLSAGVEVALLKVGNRIGRSDHHLISCFVQGITPIRRRRRRLFSKLRARELLEILTQDDNPENLLQLPPVTFFEEISLRLRSYSVTFEPKPKNFFKVIELVEDELKGVLQTGIAYVRRYRAAQVRNFMLWSTRHTLAGLMGTGKPFIR